MAVEIDTRGLDVLGTRVSSGVRAATEDTLEEGRDVAVQHCPVSDGPPHGDVHLYETIRTVMVNQYAGDLLAGDAMQNVHHAPPVNYGTYKMAGHHFMDRAAEHMQRELPAKIKKYSF